jgi:hypothetical protein
VASTPRSGRRKREDTRQFFDFDKSRYAFVDSIDVVANLDHREQYSKPIGVHHVRELAGTMEDKKAGHGILVTTSTFTKDSKILAERLVRIQLIDGPGLVHLIKQNLGKDVLVGRRAPRPS